MTAVTGGIKDLSRADAGRAHRLGAARDAGGARHHAALRRSARLALAAMGPAIDTLAAARQPYLGSCGEGT